MYVRTYSETYIGIKWNGKEEKWAYFPPAKVFIDLLIFLDKTSKNIYIENLQPGRRRRKHGSPTIAFAPKED